MYTFKELRKNAKVMNDLPGKKMKIAILGNCSTQFFATSIRGYAVLSGLSINVFDAGYDQIDAQLLDKESEVYAFQADIIILWLATDKLYERFLDMKIEDRCKFADIYISKIIGYWKTIAKNCKARIIQPNFTELNDKPLGQYSSKVEFSFIYQVRRLNFLLEEAMGLEGNIYPLDLLSIQIMMGQDRYHDAPLYYGAKMTVSTAALPSVAKAVIDIIKAMSGKMKKCIILDLDNTLWGGVIGDDGIDHIEIGGLGRGQVFTNLQKWLKQLKELGIILAICSKNDEHVAKEPFEKHEEMVLQLSDISIFVANWEDKVSNICMIQESLNIGMDSIVFIDDNPFERELVKGMIPEIEVPELPEDPALYLDHLQSQSYFDTASFTGLGSDRTEQYRAEFERKKLASSFKTIDDYLKSLKMVGEAKPFSRSKFSRIAQLTQRSNQFNLRTIRYTEDEIRRIAEDERFLTLYFNLKDSLGDHGLVSVVIMEKRMDQEVFINTWLMSCRVLKRGMEEFVMNKVVSTAKTGGFTEISSEYIPTAKNSLVKDIYMDLGFKKIGEGSYRLKIDEYLPKKTYILEGC